MFQHIQRWSLIRRQGNPVYQLRYCLVGGKVKERSTRETVRKKAERVAFEILSAADGSSQRELYGFEEFCLRYEAEHLGGRPAKTIEAFHTACTRLVNLCSPSFVTDIDSKMMVTFAVRLRAEGKSEATIQAYRDHIMASLRWAEEVELIDHRPKPPRLSRVPTGTRGRAITEEEFERMLDCLPELVGEENAPRWRWNLTGMWLSGFRLGETFSTYWEPVVEGHYLVDLDTDRPLIQIDQFSEKAFCNRLLPLTPDFAAHLREVDCRRRNGCVFKWPLSRGYTTNAKTVGKRISFLGKKAGIRTGKNKYASAHDLRRSFGTRWALKVQPFILKTLMRHSSITTTEKYYVTVDANRIGDAINKAEDTGFEPAAP